MRVHNRFDLAEVFSDREQLILKIIGKKRNMTIQMITNEMIETPGTSIPFDAEVTVGNSIRRIIKKCEAFKIHWTLKKNKIDGRMVITKEFI